MKRVFDLKKISVLFFGMILCLGVCLVGCGTTHIHTLTLVEATAATCTTDGNIECWLCSECGKRFSDEEATTELKNDSWVISATGHDYSVSSWTWDGYTSAVANLVCSNDSSHTEAVDATITSQTTATCSDDGTRTYTATVTIDGQTYTDIKEVEESALGHSYEVSWAWEEDYTSATATFSCVNGCGDSQEVYASITSETTTEATYTTTGLITYTATVSFNGETYTDTQEEILSNLSGNNYTSEETAVYDETAGLYIASTTITDDDGNEYERYTLNAYVSGQEFTISGTITNGQIYINDEDETYAITINLAGATISCSYDSPICILSAESVDISANKNTTNYIYDNREQIESDDDDDSSSLGKGAIYAKCDLKMKGNGTLYIYGNYNNGIHTTKDLTIQKETLYVEAYNNALKGNDSVTIVSGTITVVSTSGDGIKTTDSDISSSKGNQRGTVSIEGGTVNIYACFDGIDSSYDVEISGSSTIVNIYTWTYAYDECGLIDTSLNSYSSSTSANSMENRQNNMVIPGNQKENEKETDPESDGNEYKTVYSCKGIKANNQITISAGMVKIYAVDDAIHANNDEELENEATPLGYVTISGGTVTLASLDDAIHADGKVTVEGGTIFVETSYEGIEGNLIYITDGTITVYAEDDAVNGCDGDETALVSISGGTLNVYVPCGDCDGIDSNGNYTQTGGVVVTCSATSDNSGVASALDVDEKISVSGESTLVLAGAFSGSVSTSLNSHSFKASSFKAGTYTIVSGDSTILTFTLDTNDDSVSTFSALAIYSYLFETGTSYSLCYGSSTIETWTQA